MRKLAIAGALALGVLLGGAVDHLVETAHAAQAYQGANVTNATGTLAANHGGTGVANNAAATLTRSGSHALTLTTTGTTSLTLPTSGTVATVSGNLGASTGTSHTVTDLLSQSRSTAGINIAVSARNTSAADGSGARIQIGNDVTQNLLTIDGYSSATTGLASRVRIVNQASTLELGGEGDMQLILGSKTANRPAMGACGTSPSIVGGDSAMRITVGSGGAATSCAATFNRTWTAAPACVAQNNTDRVAYSMVTTTTTLTITATAAFTAGSIFHVHCIGVA